MCEQISSWLRFAWVRRNGGSCKPSDSVSVTVRQPWSASRPGYALNKLLSQINMWSVVISAFGSFLSERSLLNSECSTGLINAQPVSSLNCSWSVQCRKRMRASKVEYTPDRHLNKLLFANNSGFSTRPANDPSYFRSHMDLAAAVRHFRVEACIFNPWLAGWLHEAPLVDDLQLAYLHDLSSQHGFTT